VYQKCKWEDREENPEYRPLGTRLEVDLLRHFQFSQTLEMSNVTRLSCKGTSHSETILESSFTYCAETTLQEEFNLSLLVLHNSSQAHSLLHPWITSWYPEKQMETRWIYCSYFLRLGLFGELLYTSDMLLKLTLYTPVFLFSETVGEWQQNP
jgi:hypothetical protein